MSKIESELFSASSSFEQKQCPKCGGKLQIKHGHTGSFLGCDNYPTCTYKESLKPQETQEDQVLAGSSCPECGSELAVKKGRYGLFIGCTQYPDCSYIADQNKTEETLIKCPSCHKGELIQRNSRHGKKFYSCNQYPKCKYIVNDVPVAEACPECKWGILVEKRTSAGLRYSCPQKSCSYKGRLLSK